jgi:hypothetical protein
MAAAVAMTHRQAYIPSGGTRASPGACSPPDPDLPASIWVRFVVCGARKGCRRVPFQNRGGAAEAEGKRVEPNGFGHRPRPRGHAAEPRWVADEVAMGLVTCGREAWRPPSVAPPRLSLP